MKHAILFLLFLLMIPLVNASITYQENASSWGSNTTGIGSWIDIGNLIDSDYSTQGVDNASNSSYSYIFENYTYPVGTIINASLQIKDATFTGNVSINFSLCNTTNSINIGLINYRVEGAGCIVRWFCYDTSNNEHNLRYLNYAGDINVCNPYEDGVFWNIADPPPLPSSDLFVGAFAAIGIGLIIAASYWKRGGKK